ncbi:L,D-transpeptidase family protein [Alicyclobacillus herbarius]|uniref:L,D-transpeptidase family protein n=1 Tax=Alicyclobacillus herbarius TaxID=122960 RepID=UPI0004046D61|nr:L,D-transpeptidase family protein [Alicyclobacillus herbarius]
MKPIRFLLLTIGLGLGLVVGDPIADAQTGHSPHVIATRKVFLKIDTRTRQMEVFLNGVLWKKYPVAVGKPDTPSPVGQWVIIDKQENWGSGFGTRWMRLNVPWGIYGIHGTNKPASIGYYTSNGCIRMQNHDVEELYGRVPIGTRVYILGNPLYRLRTLKEGHIGADVQLVQARLKKLGFYNGPVNGRFDPRLERALKDFERAHGLPVNGIVTRKDYQALGLVK